LEAFHQFQQDPAEKCEVSDDERIRCSVINLKFVGNVMHKLYSILLVIRQVFPVFLSWFSWSKRFEASFSAQLVHSLKSVDLTCMHRERHAEAVLLNIIKPVFYFRFEKRN